MPINYKPTKYAFNTEGPSLTEQEHHDSCDINKMLRSAARGQVVRGRSSQLRYGEDDTTLDGLTHRIRRQELEEELATGPQEFPEEILKKMPDGVKKKFGFKASSKSKKQADDPLKNDDKTTKKSVDPAEKKDTQQKPSKTDSSSDPSDGFDYR